MWSGRQHTPLLIFFFNVATYLQNRRKIVQERSMLKRLNLSGFIFGGKQQTKVANLRTITTKSAPFNSSDTDPCAGMPKIAPEIKKTM